MAALAMKATPVPRNNSSKPRNIRIVLLIMVPAQSQGVRTGTVNLASNLASSCRVRERLHAAEANRLPAEVHATTSRTREKRQMHAAERRNDGEEDKRASSKGRKGASPW